MGSKLSAEQAALWQPICAQFARECESTHRSVIAQAARFVKQTGGQPDASFLRALADRESARFASDNRDCLLRIWTLYDLNRDGSLDLRETKVLLGQSLVAQRKFLPHHMPTLFEAVISAGLDMARELGASERDVTDSRRALMAKQKDALPKAIRAFEDSIDGIVKNADKLAEALFERMDLNGDGKISWDEFSTYYLATNSEIIDVHKVMTLIHEAMGDLATVVA